MQKLLTRLDTEMEQQNAAKYNAQHPNKETDTTCIYADPPLRYSIQNKRNGNQISANMRLIPEYNTKIEARDFIFNHKISAQPTSYMAALGNDSSDGKKIYTFVNHWVFKRTNYC